MENLNIGIHQERSSDIVDYMTCVDYHQNIHNKPVNNSFHNLFDFNLSNVQQPEQGRVNCDEAYDFTYPQHNIPQSASFPNEMITNNPPNGYYIDIEGHNANNFNNRNNSGENIDIYELKFPLLYCKNDACQDYFEYASTAHQQLPSLPLHSTTATASIAASSAQPSMENYVYSSNPSLKSSNNTLHHVPHIVNIGGSNSECGDNTFSKDDIITSTEKLTSSTINNTFTDSHMLLPSSTYVVPNTIAWLRDIVNMCIYDSDCEFTLTVSQPKVAQKSYGDEKRFLTPPIIVLSGNGWGISLECKEHNKYESEPSSTSIINHHDRIVGDGKKALLLCKVLFSIPHPPTTIIFKPICKHKNNGENGLHPLEKINKIIKPQKPAVVAFLQKLHVDATDPRKEVTIQYKIVCPIGVFNVDAPPMVKLSKPSKRKRASFSSLLIRSNTMASFFNRTKSQSSSTTFLGSNGIELTPCNGPQEDWVVHLVSKTVFEDYLRNMETINAAITDGDYHYNHSTGNILTPSTTPSSICHNKFTETHDTHLLSGFTYPPNFFVDSVINTSSNIQGKEGSVLHYGDIVVLKNLSTGFLSCPFILRRVEKTGWCIVEEDCDSINEPQVSGNNASYAPSNTNTNNRQGCGKFPFTFLKKDNPHLQRGGSKIPISPLHRVAFEFALKPMHFLCLNTGRKVQSPTVGISSAITSFISQPYNNNSNNTGNTSSNEDLLSDHKAMLHKVAPHLYGKMCHKSLPSTAIHHCRNVYEPNRCDNRRSRTASSPYSIPPTLIEQNTSIHKNRQRGVVSFDVDIGEACVWTVISIIRKECTFLLKKSTEGNYPQIQEHHYQLQQITPNVINNPTPDNNANINTGRHQSSLNLLNYECPETDQYLLGGPCPNYYENLVHSRHVLQKNAMLDLSQHDDIPPSPQITIALDPIPEICNISLFPSPASDPLSEKGEIVVVAFGKNLSDTYLFFGTQNVEDISISSEGSIVRCILPTRNFPDSSKTVPILIARSDGLIFKSGWQWNPKESTVSPVLMDDFVSSPH